MRHVLITGALVMVLILGYNIDISAQERVPLAVKLAWSSVATFLSGDPIEAPVGYRVWRSRVPFESVEDSNVRLAATIDPGGDPECIIRIHKSVQRACTTLIGHDALFYWRVTSFYVSDGNEIESFPSEMVVFNPNNPPPLEEKPETPGDLTLETLAGPPSQ